MACVHLFFRHSPEQNQDLVRDELLCALQPLDVCRSHTLAHSNICWSGRANRNGKQKAETEIIFCVRVDLDLMSIGDGTDRIADATISLLEH